MAFDTLITGGAVIDGSGASRRLANVGISDGRIEAVGAKVVNKRSTFGNFVFFHAEMLHDDLLYAIGCIAHVLIPSRCPVCKNLLSHCLYHTRPWRCQQGKAGLGTMNIGKGQDPEWFI